MHPSQRTGTAGEERLASSVTGFMDPIRGCSFFNDINKEAVINVAQSHSYLILDALPFTFSIAASRCFIVILEWIQAAFSLAGRPDSCTETQKDIQQIHSQLYH